MNKPITLVRADFIQDMANIINKSGLPPFVIEPILKDFLNEVRVAMNNQYENDKAKYEKDIKQENAKNTTKTKN